MTLYDTLTSKPAVHVPGPEVVVASRTLRAVAQPALTGIFEVDGIVVSAPGPHDEDVRQRAVHVPGGDGVVEAADDLAGGVLESCVEFVVGADAVLVALVLDDVQAAPAGAGLKGWGGDRQGCCEQGDDGGGEEHGCWSSKRGLRWWGSSR